MREKIVISVDFNNKELKKIALRTKQYNITRDEYIGHLIDWDNNVPEISFSTYMKIIDTHLG